jgi:hypothetical protein
MVMMLTPGKLINISSLCCVLVRGPSMASRVGGTSRLDDSTFELPQCFGKSEAWNLLDINYNIKPKSNP